jgi:hypothetical protein
MKKIILVSTLSCSPCRTMEAILQEYGVEYVKMSPESAVREIGYIAMCVPTLVQMFEGAIVSSLSGLHSLQKILEFCHE